MADIPVLVVEDSRSMQAAVTDLLRSIGPFSVAETAATEARATEWLLQHPDAWQVALVDLLLQDGSGFNVVCRLKREHPAGHVIVFSEFATEPLKQKCLALGADAVFRKSEMTDLIRHLAGVGEARSA